MLRSFDPLEVEEQLGKVSYYQALLNAAYAEAAEQTELADLETDVWYDQRAYEVEKQLIKERELEGQTKTNASKISAAQIKSRIMVNKDDRDKYVSFRHAYLMWNKRRSTMDRLAKTFENFGHNLRALLAKYESERRKSV